MTIDKKPLVSVVIPTYNRELQVKKTIKSVLKQTYSNFEIIIVDDASTDNTEQTVRAIHDDRIRFIKLSVNSHGTLPRNTGIKESKGEYIALLDSDDEWVPTKLEKQMEFIQKNKNKSNIMCFTNSILRNDKGERIVKNSSLKDNEDIMDYIFVGGNLVQTSTFLFPSGIGKKTLFNPTLKKHQDWDFCLRLRDNGVNFVLLPEPLTIYNVEKREGRISNNSKYLLSIEWGQKVKNSISRKAYYGFKVISLTDAFILNKKKFQALSIYLSAYFNNAIKVKKLCKGLLKCSLPHFILKHII
ncbi:glycosyltransferase family A protein [Priestia megaterium]|uniref:glycosyltransferase family 2 protein n=1 Tax=Priestia megaterium TaxID=1404 RepID=UPI002E21EAC8|nr:glycosyltransferase family A protein [Priestia megaterium]